MRHCIQSTQRRDRGWQVAMSFVASLLITGCSLTVPATPDDHSPSPPVVTERASADEIWNALASAVKAKTIDSTTRLAQFVAVLARNGELSQDDTTAFDVAFPGITRASRDLTEADADVLIGLAQKARK